jgi:hypothetical protein
MGNFVKICILNPEKIPAYFPDRDGRWRIHRDFPSLKWAWHEEINFAHPVDALLSEQKGKSDGSLYLSGLRIKLFNSQNNPKFEWYSDIYKANVPSSYNGHINYHFPHHRLSRVWLNLAFNKLTAQS